MRNRSQSSWSENLYWFVISLVLAIVVWFIAAIQANPIEQRAFSRIPITILVDEGMIITEQSSQLARAFVRAQSDTLAILQQDDVTISVNLQGKQAGTYTIPLAVQISRQATADTQPAQITVTIEQEIAQQVPVEIDVIAPPINFAADTVQRDVYQVEVRGAVQSVSQVERVMAVLDLSEQERPDLVEQVLPLVAVDADNRTVENLVITPNNIALAVDVTQRQDVRTFTIRPDIDYTSLAENFAILGFEVHPNTVTINASPEVLANLGDTIDTETISLDGQTSDFSVEIALDFPQTNDIVILSDNSTARVDISISERTTTLPIEDVPIRMIGADERFNVTMNPVTMSSIVLSGPASIIDQLAADDVVAFIDVHNLVAGTYTLEPQIELAQGQVNMADVNITLLPTTVTVTIAAPEAPENSSAQP